MRASEARAPAGRDRAEIGARSVLAHLCLFIDQGLAGSTRSEIERCASALSGPRHLLSDDRAAALTRELRDLLGDVCGPTAAVLVAEFADVLGGMAGAGSRPAVGRA